MEEKRVDTERFEKPENRKMPGSDTMIVHCVVFLFLIVLITAVSILQSSRIRLLEKRMQVLENRSVAAFSERTGREGMNRLNHSEDSIR
jgi:hypothetical protein